MTFRSKQVKLLVLAGLVALLMSAGAFLMMLFRSDLEWVLPAGMILLVGGIGLLMVVQIVLQRQQLWILDSLRRAASSPTDQTDMNFERLTEDVRRLGDFWGEISAEILARLEHE